MKTWRAKLASGWFELDRFVVEEPREAGSYTETYQPVLLAPVAELQTQERAGSLFLKKNRHWDWLGNRS